MNRTRGLSVRLKLTISYAGFLLFAGVLLLGAVWVFLLRDRPLRMLAPSFPNLLRAFDPSNFGPAVFGSAAVLVLTFLLIWGLLGGWILAGRMLAPLNRISDATRMAASGSLTHRIQLPGRSDEFRELADAFDAMLARLEAQIGEQQRFAANASHELRTPLAATQALLEVAHRDPVVNAHELIERLQAVNARAINLTEALLLLSRADQRAFTTEPVDLSLLAEEAIETLIPFAEKRGVTVETSCDITPTLGSRALLLQMVTNLLQNAIVHNLPQRGMVKVITAVHAGSVTLTVENSGEQLTPQRVATLTEPFQRGAERTRSDHAGVGLGLAIVKSIVQAHGGTLILSPRAAGGLRATVRLPAHVAIE